MKKTLLQFLSCSFIVMSITIQSLFSQTYHTLSGGSFSQDWTNTGLLSVDDDWNSVASIIGYRGDGGTSSTGVDPQSVLADLSSVLDLIANQTNPSTNSSGGIAEFEITDPVVAFQGSGTADAPNIVIYINTTGCSNVKIKYLLRDIDGAADDAAQAVALQYRLGATGDFINIPEAFVADASTGPSLNNLVTPVDVLLPSACFNQAQVELRIITTNAGGSDEWIGIDNIVVEVDATAPVPVFDPANSAVDVPVSVTPTITFNEPVRKTDGNALENSDLASLVVLKKTDASGDNVPFAATIDDSKKIITITPSASLDNSQLYYLAVGAVEDMSGNETTGSNITFTTVSASAATVTITAPTGGETYYAGQNVDLTWTSANVDNVKIEAWVVDSDRTYKWETLVETMPAASGLLNFDIPGDALYGTGYQIRISDASNASLSSTSGNFTIIAVATSLTDLKTRCIVNDIVKISSEVTVTFLRSSANRNQKYIQDSGAGLLIDDASSVLTTPLAVGDNIQNLEGKLGYYNGMNQIVPTKATVSVASSGNTPVVTTVTIAEFTGSFDPYEARLIKLVNVNFPTADGSATFGSEKTYDLSDGVNTVKFFTFEAPESDIVGTVIPSGNYDVTGLAMRYNTTVEIASRTLNDLSLVTGIENALQRDDIRLYPVPASSQLNLSNVPGLRSVEVLDIAGKVIRTINTSSDEVIGIPVSGLTRGTYILKINTTEGTMVRRFVKQ